VRWISALALAGFVFTTAAHAEAIKIGILKVGASGPVYLAQDRGYFTAEGLAVTLENFGAGQAVALVAALAIMVKYLGGTAADLDTQIPYVDPHLGLDVMDIARQIAWYRSQGMVKGDITVDRLIDKRYGVPQH
jgi:hypothetical protein